MTNQNFILKLGKEITLKLAFDESLHPRDAYGHWIHGVNQSVKEITDLRQKYAKKYPKSAGRRGSLLRRLIATKATNIKNAKIGELVTRNKVKVSPETFHALAWQQRDKPEKAMNKAQKVLGGGLVSSIIEHSGDLIHRMSERPTFNSGGYEFVKEKVHKLDSWLNENLMSSIHENNIKSTAKYLKIPVETHRNNVNKALERYVHEHKKLPTYNFTQKLAKIAAVSAGQRKFHVTRAAIRMLKNRLQDRNTWMSFVHKGVKK